MAARKNTPSTQRAVDDNLQLTTDVARISVVSLFISVTRQTVPT